MPEVSWYLEKSSLNWARPGDSAFTSSSNDGERQDFNTVLQDQKECGDIGTLSQENVDIWNLIGNTKRHLPIIVAYSLGGSSMKCFNKRETLCTGRSRKAFLVWDWDCARPVGCWFSGSRCLPLRGKRWGVWKIEKGKEVVVIIPHPFWYLLHRSLGRDTKHDQQLLLSQRKTFSFIRFKYFVRLYQICLNNPIILKPYYKETSKRKTHLLSLSFILLAKWCVIDFLLLWPFLAKGFYNRIIKGWVGEHPRSKSRNVQSSFKDQAHNSDNEDTWSRHNDCADLCRSSTVSQDSKMSVYFPLYQGRKNDSFTLRSNFYAYIGQGDLCL